MKVLFFSIIFCWLYAGSYIQIITTSRSIPYSEFYKAVENYNLPTILKKSNRFYVVRLGPFSDSQARKILSEVKRTYKDAVIVHSNNKSFIKAYDPYKQNDEYIDEIIKPEQNIKHESSIVDTNEVLNEKGLCKYYAKKDILNMARYIPKNPRVDSECAKRALGYYYYSIEEYNKSVKYYSKLFKYEVEDVLCYSNALIKLKKIREAYKLLDDILKYDNNELKLNFAIVNLKLNNKQKAKKYLFEILNSVELDENTKKKALMLINKVGY